MVVRPLRKGPRGLMNLLAVVLRGSAVAEIEPLSQVDAGHPDRPVLGRYFAKQMRAGPAARIRSDPEKFRRPSTRKTRFGWRCTGNRGNWPSATSMSRRLVRVRVAIHRRGVQPEHLPVGHLLPDDVLQLRPIRSCRASGRSTISTASNTPTARSPGRSIGRPARRSASGSTPNASRCSRAGAGTASGARRGRLSRPPAPAQPPFLTLDALNHPIFSWAEREYAGHRRPPTTGLGL